MTDFPQRDEASPAASASMSYAAAVLRLMRPRQWTKNLLLFAALVFAQELFHPRSLALAVLGFVAFCLASSSGYVVNDWFDVDHDRAHPEKRTRPIAAGLISESAAAVIAIVLTGGALALAFALNATFGIVVVLYLAQTHFYSWVGKNIPILDVMLIASGFVIRAWAGALAIDVPTSSWFVLCTLFGALFLALSKRKAEILALEAGAGRHRPVLEHYTPRALDGMASASVAAVLMSYALYILNEAEADPRVLAMTLPFAIFGVFRYQLLVETSGLGDKPEEVLLSDRPIQLCVVGFSLAAVAAYYLGA